MKPEENKKAPDREQKNKEGAHCLLQHLKFFHKQALKEEIADFGEPCSMCSQATECGFDWFERIKVFIDMTDITINLDCSEHRNK